MSDQLHVTGTATLAAGSIVDVVYGGQSDSVFRTGDSCSVDHRRHA